MKPQADLRYRVALEALLGLPATAGNQVDVLRNGEQFFPAMLEAVRGARHTVDLHTFGHWDGAVGAELTSALCERARGGVRVRVLLDSLGARHFDRPLIDAMADAGVDLQWFRPLTNWRVTQSTHRGHRKVLVCDNRVGFTGGFGISDRWQGDARRPGEWRDTAVRLRGPAVNGLRGAFLNNWAETYRPLFDEEVDPFPRQPPAGASEVQVVRGEAETGWGDISTLVRSFIGLARHRLRISASYFVPDEGALELLCAAAAGGVSVELLRPGEHVNSRLSLLASDAQMQRLLDRGVRAWSYVPAVLQAKVMTVDGVMASVGPANFNSRSLTLDDEVNAVIFDPAVVGVLDAQFDDDLGRSQELDPRDWAARGMRRRAMEAAPGFLARHL